MGSYILKKTAYQVAVRPDGRLLVFTFSNGYDKNTYPHTERWNLACVGDPEKTLRHIGVVCANLEDGITQVPGKTTALEWAEQQIKALLKPIPVISLPDEVTLREPSFGIWMAFGDHFDDEKHARQSFDGLLQQWGKKVGDTLYPVSGPASTADFLMQLDKFSRRCHNAWPERPDMSIGLDRQLAMEVLEAPEMQEMLGAQMDQHGAAASAMTAYSIEGMPNIAIWSSAASASGWAIGSKLQMMQHYWQNVFPAQALRADWQEGYRDLLRQVDETEPVAQDTITLSQPGIHAHPASQADWVDLYGESQRTGCLDVVANRFSGHVIGEMLLHSCEVAHFSPDDDQSDRTLALRAVKKDAGVGPWRDMDGPTTGVGNEFWFARTKDPAEVTDIYYVCVDQGEVCACSKGEGTLAANRLLHATDGGDESADEGGNRPVAN